MKASAAASASLHAKKWLPPRPSPQGRGYGTLSALQYIPCPSKPVSKKGVPQMAKGKGGNGEGVNVHA